MRTAVSRRGVPATWRGPGPRCHRGRRAWRGRGRPSRHCRLSARPRAGRTARAGQPRRRGPRRRPRRAAGREMAAGCRPGPATGPGGSGSRLRGAHLGRVAVLAAARVVVDRLHQVCRCRRTGHSPGRGAPKSLTSSCRLPRAPPGGYCWRGVLGYGRRLPRRRRVPHDRGMGVLLSVDGGESPWGTVSVGASLSSSFLAGRSGTCRGGRTVRHGALVRRCSSTPIARRISRLLSGLRTARSSRSRLLLLAARGYPARVRRLRELEESAGAAWRRMKAQKRRPARRRVSRRRRAKRFTRIRGGKNRVKVKQPARLVEKRKWKEREGGG